MQRRRGLKISRLQFLLEPTQLRPKLTKGVPTIIDHATPLSTEVTPENLSVASGDPEEGGEVLKKKSDTAGQISNNVK